jgi:integration host factor subunit beta
LVRPKLIRQLKQKNPKINQSETEAVIDTFYGSVEKALIEGKKIELRGFGTFFIKKIREKYSARNPKTGELIYIPEKNKVRFRASKNLKKIINE